MAEKIKLPPVSWKGIDYTFNNLSTVASVRTLVNTVIIPLYKEKGRAYIGLKERMDVGEILELGLYKTLYKVVKSERNSPKTGAIYMLVRIDGANITQWDIDAIKKGDKVRIKNRKSFKQLFNDFLIFKDNG